MNVDQSTSSQRIVELQKQAIPGGWKEEVVTVGGRSFTLLLPADPDQFLDFITPNGNHPSWPDPYWAKLWPMSLELAAMIMQAKWSKETRIIEIGCGVGMAGIAALAGGWSVTFSDYVPLAMDLAVANALRNNLSGSEQLWLDWREPTPQQFDVVLASEVLYDRTLHPPILHTLDAILSPVGRVWFADPGRTATEEFIPLARKSGWQVTIVNRAGEVQDKLRFNQFNRLELTRSEN